MTPLHQVALHPGITSGVRHLFETQLEQKLSAIPGLLGSALIDIHTGTCVARSKTGDLDITPIAESRARTLQAQSCALQAAGCSGELGDVELHLTRQTHFLYVLSTAEVSGAYLLVILDRTQADEEVTQSRIAEILASLRKTEDANVPAASANRAFPNRTIREPIRTRGVRVRNIPLLHTPQNPH